MRSTPEHDMENIRALLNARMQEAENREIVKKAIEVSKLGTTHPKKHGSMHIFEDPDINIEWDDYGDNLSVFWHGEYVLSTHLGHLVRYRPDLPLWECRIDELYDAQAMPALKAKKLAAKAAELTALEENWGVSVASLEAGLDGLSEEAIEA